VACGSRQCSSPNRPGDRRRRSRFFLIRWEFDYNLARPDEAELLPGDVLDEYRVSSQSLNVALELLDSYRQVLKLVCRRCVLGERAAELSSSVRVNRRTHPRRRQDYRQDYSIHETLCANPSFDSGSNSYSRTCDWADSDSDAGPVDQITPICICGLTQVAPPILGRSKLQRTHEPKA
jgi:hypothetical protein